MSAPTARSTAQAAGYGRVGDAIVIAAGMPFSKAGTTNLLHVAQLETTTRDVETTPFPASPREVRCTNPEVVRLPLHARADAGTESCQSAACAQRGN